MRLFRLLPLLLISVWLLACNSETQSQTDKTKTTAKGGNKISLSGQIKNYDTRAGDLKIFRINANQRQEVLRITPGSDGTFAQDIAVNFPDLYILQFGKTENWLVLSDASLTLTMDAYNPATFELKGESQDVTLYNEFLGLKQRHTGTVQEINKDYSLAATDAQRTALQEKYAKISEVYYQNLKQLTEKAKGRLSLFLPAQELLQEEREVLLLAELTKELSEKNPKSEVVSYLLKNTEKAKATAVGVAAPDFTLNNPEGQAIALSSLRGKYVLIDFWASWCGPCRRENPNVVRVYQKYKSKGFEILGVSLDQDRQAWLDAIAKDGLAWKHVSDLAQWQSAVVPLYNIQGIPLTVLLDKDGKIVAKNLRGQALEDKLAELLN